jgi:hypothetical protein
MTPGIAQVFVPVGLPLIGVATRLVQPQQFAVLGVFLEQPSRSAVFF